MDQHLVALAAGATGPIHILTANRPLSGTHCGLMNPPRGWDRFWEVAFDPGNLPPEICQACLAQARLFSRRLFLKRASLEGPRG